MLCGYRREVKKISLVNYDLLVFGWCVRLRLETDVIQVMAVINRHLTVMIRTHPHTWKAEWKDRLTGRFICNLVCAQNILWTLINVVCRRRIFCKIISSIILTFVPVDM
jgi:hypothetical protein